MAHIRDLGFRGSFSPPYPLLFWRKRMYLVTQMRSHSHVRHIKWRENKQSIRETGDLEQELMVPSNS